MSVENLQSPYLCGGTFFSLLLMAKPQGYTSKEHTNGKKDICSEADILKKLVNISNLTMPDDGYKYTMGSSLTTITSNYKSCNIKSSDYVKCYNKDKFDADVKKGFGSIALKMMIDFVDECLDESNLEYVIKCILGLIQEDSTIGDAEFVIIGKDNKVNKTELLSMKDVIIESFLLGVWHYIIMVRSEDNMNGRSTIEYWREGLDKNQKMRECKIGEYYNNTFKIQHINKELLKVEGTPSSTQSATNTNCDEENNCYSNINSEATPDISFTPNNSQGGAKDSSDAEEEITLMEIKYEPGVYDTLDMLKKEKTKIEDLLKINDEFLGDVNLEDYLVNGKNNSYFYEDITIHTANVNRIKDKLGYYKEYTLLAEIENLFQNYEAYITALREYLKFLRDNSSDPNRVLYDFRLEIKNNATFSEKEELLKKKIRDQDNLVCNDMNMLKSNLKKRLEEVTSAICSINKELYGGS